MSSVGELDGPCEYPGLCLHLCPSLCLAPLALVIFFCACCYLRRRRHPYLCPAAALVVTSAAALALSALVAQSPTDASFLGSQRPCDPREANASALPILLLAPG
eukprot:3453846-Pleurochrysis_carterae.AAC.1